MHINPEGYTRTYFNCETYLDASYEARFYSRVRQPEWQVFGVFQRHDLLLLCTCNWVTDLSRQLVLELYVVVLTIPQRMQCTLTVSRVWANAK